MAKENDSKNVLLDEFSPHYMVFPSQRALKVGAAPGEGNCGKCTRIELRPDGSVVASFGARRMVLAAAGWGWEATEPASKAKDAA
jgi:hypothetical protein